MNIEQLKELWDTGDYVCYMDNKQDFIWKINMPDFDGLDVQGYKLIHKKDSHIADAVIENPDVEVEWRVEGRYWDYPFVSMEDAEFFETYSTDINVDYRLKEPKQDFNGGYADEEAFKAVDEFLDNVCSACDTHKTYCKCDNPEEKETISITSEDGVEYKFEKPEFSHKLYEIVDNVIFGRVWNTKEAKWKPKRWKLNGGVLGARELNYYDLTPIKKAWYEDESLLPILVYSDLKKFEVLNNFADKRSSHRLATKAERDSLYCKN